MATTGKKYRAAASKIEDRPYELKEAIIEVAAAGNEPDGLIRVLLGRGPGGFGLDPCGTPFPRPPAPPLGVSRAARGISVSRHTRSSRCRRCS